MGKKNGRSRYTCFDRLMYVAQQYQYIINTLPFRTNVSDF